MIKQITCKEIKDYIKKNPKSVLLDVRTQEEWDNDGKPDGDKVGLKTYFLEIKRDAFFDFVKEFKNLNINYEEKFKFPFIIAVKGKNKNEILDNFKKRIKNNLQEEFNEAKIQVKKIALFRLKDVLKIN